MKTMDAILRKYTAGEYSVEEANKELAAIKSSLRVDPMKNVITEDELRRTTVGAYPDMANGFGMLDTGTGTLDKVEVKNGKMLNCDCGNMYAIVFIAGRMYKVKGNMLTK